MENWENKIQVKKGNYGEKIVRKYLESNGWIVYEPETSGPHAFDMLCVKDKEKIIIAEVKTKARMNKWNATGFNIKSLNEYSFIQKKYGIDIFIIFVDEFLKKVYGNKLSELIKPYKAKDGDYPKTINNEIILFSLEKMINVADITDDEAVYLIENTKRNYPYEVGN